MDGAYVFVYAGLFGIGSGFLTVTGSHVWGLDCGGGQYRGTAMLDKSTGEVTISFHIFEPRGIVLVDPGPLRDYLQRVTITLPPDFGHGQPIKLAMPHDVVTLVVTPIGEASLRDASCLSIATKQFDSRSGRRFH